MPKGKKLFKKHRNHTKRYPVFTDSVQPGSQRPTLHKDIVCRYSDLPPRVIGIANQMLTKYPKPIAPFKYELFSFRGQCLFDIIYLGKNMTTHGVSIQDAEKFFGDMIDWQAVETTLCQLPLPIYQKLIPELIPPRETMYYNRYNVCIDGSMITTHYYECGRCAKFFPIDCNAMYYIYLEDKVLCDGCWQLLRATASRLCN